MPYKDPTASRLANRERQRRCLQAVVKMDNTRYAYAEISAQGRTVSGVLVRYGEVAPRFGERIEAGAFGNLVTADLVLNIQHVRSRALCRTGGAGLTLTDSAQTLDVSARLPSTIEADDALTLIRSGVLRGLSAEYRVTARRQEGDVEVVTGAKLVGLAVVDRPAYPSSKIESVRQQPVETTELDRRWLLV